MASKIKADQFETLDGSGNITLNNSVTMASGKTLPAASLTGALPAISGASLTGVTSVGGATGADFTDNTKLRWGTGNDLEIYHDGSHSYIKDVGTGDLRLMGTNLSLRSESTNEPYLNATENGAVTLYYDNVAKLATSSAGGTLTGTWTGAGKVLQVVSTTVTDTPSITTSSGWVDWAGLSVTITPSASSSKVLITASVNVSDNADSAQRLVRGSTAICIGDQVGSNRNRATTGGNIHRGPHEMMQYSVNYLDSPNTTSATTYKMQATDNNSDTQYLNREHTDSDQADDSIGASTITVMEIGA